MSDLEIVQRLNSSGLGIPRLSQILNESEQQIRLILNCVCVINPKLRKLILSSVELKDLWH